MSINQIKSMFRIIFLKKGLKTFLILWLLLCILPGDCFILGCGEKDISYSTHSESVTLSHHDACCSTQDDRHCPDCCVLCANNITLHILPCTSFPRNSSSLWLRTPPLNHPNSIFQKIIYHPPRLTA